MHHPTDRIAHTMAFVNSVMVHWLDQNEKEVELKYLMQSMVTWVTESGYHGGQTFPFQPMLPNRHMYGVRTLTQDVMVVVFISLHPPVYRCFAPCLVLIK